MAVVFEELAGSPSLRLADGKFQGTRKFKVAWSDVVDFVIELVGGYRVVSEVLTYVPPATFPLAPLATVGEVSCEPFPPDRPDGVSIVDLSTGANDYAWALVTAQYRIRFEEANKARADLPDVPEGTLLTYSSDLGLEYEATPGRTFLWSADSSPVADDVHPGIVVPTEEMRLSWQRVPSPPWDAIRDLRGKVNDATFLNHAAGTVLFVGARTSREFQILDPGLFRLDYHFRVREVQSTASAGTRFGWNHRYRQEAVTGEHWLEIADQDGNRPYAEGDFLDLFAFAT